MYALIIANREEECVLCTSETAEPLEALAGRLKDRHPECRVRVFCMAHPGETFLAPALQPPHRPSGSPAPRSGPVKRHGC